MMATAIIGPTPGMVMSLLISASFFVRARISRSSRAMFAQKLNLFKNLLQGEASGSRNAAVVLIVCDGDKCLQTSCTLGGRDPQFSQMGPKCINRLRPLAYGQGARPEDHARCLLFSRFDGDKSHRLSRQSFVDRFRVIEIALSPLHKGLHIGWMDQRTSWPNSAMRRAQ